MAVLFHLLFRVSALVLYLVAHYVTHMGEMGVMITIILLLAVDFWTVKNITGRILAGLRWWNKVEEDGTSTWVFEWRKVSYDSEVRPGVELADHVTHQHNPFDMSAQTV